MFIKAVNERTSGRYSGTLYDQNGAVVPAGSLSTLTLTLYDVDTDTIINNRNAQNVLNDNDVTVDSGGVVTWQVQPADVAIVTAGASIEFHRALFVATWSNGEAAWEMTLTVMNLAHLT